MNSDGHLKMIWRALTASLLAAFLSLSLATPATARFLSPDTFNPWDPGVDINRYAYSGNDPINNSDPNGHAGIKLIDPTIADESPAEEGSVDDIMHDPAFQHELTFERNVINGAAGTAAAASSSARMHAAEQANKRIPNPFGRKGDLVTQARVADVVKEIEARGNKARFEYRVTVTNGYKTA